MNDLIKELSEQAGFIHFSPDEDSDTPIDWSCDYTTELEKFAELIVRECIEQGNNLANHYINTHPEQVQVMLLASIADYKNEIKQHFGVVE